MVLIHKVQQRPLWGDNGCLVLMVHRRNGGAISPLTEVEILLPEHYFRLHGRGGSVDNKQ